MGFEIFRKKKQNEIPESEKARLINAMMKSNMTEQDKQTKQSVQPRHLEKIWPNTEGKFKQKQTLEETEYDETAQDIFGLNDKNIPEQAPVLRLKNEDERNLVGTNIKNKIKSVWTDTHQPIMQNQTDTKATATQNASEDEELEIIKNLRDGDAPKERPRKKIVQLGDTNPEDVKLEDLEDYKINKETINDDTN